MSTCENCRFWEREKTSAPQNGAAMGYCRKNPPAAMACLMPKLHRIENKVIPTLVEITVWSKTMAAAWCGGFEPKRKPLRVLSQESLVKREEKLKGELGTKN